MQPLKWITSILVFITLCHIRPGVTAATGLRLKRQNLDTDDLTSDLDPLNAQDVSVNGLDREKRKIPEAAFEAKNAVLGFVFSRIFEPSRPSRTVTVKPSKYEDDAVEFDRARVSLEVPDKLFGQSFTTLTSVSKIVSRWMMNSARRYSRFVLFFKPLFGDALTVKGYEDPTTTTTSISPLEDLNNI